MTMIIKNKRLDIDTNDVYESTDLVELYDWRVNVAITYYNLTNKINKARATKAELGTYVDREWYQRTDDARRLQEILLFQIEHRIQELKDELDNKD